jgi:hypothetical protein
MKPLSRFYVITPVLAALLAATFACSPGLADTVQPHDDNPAARAARHEGIGFWKAYTPQGSMLRTQSLNRSGLAALQLDVARRVAPRLRVLRYDCSGYRVAGILVIILVAKGKAGAIRDRIRRDQKTGAPWMHYAFSVTGAIGNLLVLALASFKWWQGAGTFQQCLYDIPLWWLPATLLIISLLVLWMENLINA